MENRRGRACRPTISMKFLLALKAIYKGGGGDQDAHPRSRKTATLTNEMLIITTRLRMMAGNMIAAEGPKRVALAHISSEISQNGSAPGWGAGKLLRKAGLSERGKILTNGNPKLVRREQDDN